MLAWRATTSLEGPTDNGPPTYVNQPWRWERWWERDSNSRAHGGTDGFKLLGEIVRPLLTAG